MKKRSWLAIEGLFVILVCAIIFLSFIQAAKSFGSREAYYKAAIARDIALIIDSLYSIPGDAKIEYSNDLSRYSISVKNNEVRVYKTTYDFTDVTIGKYTFYGQKMLETRILYPDVLIIEKKNGKISLHG